MVTVQCHMLTKNPVPGFIQGQWRQRVSNIGGDDLPLPFSPAPLPPFPPSPPYPSPPSPSLPLEVRPLNPARGSGERC